MTSSAEWYYAKGGTRYGPVSMDQLKELAARGRLGPDDLVWREGLETWVRGRTIPDLPFPPPVAANSGGHAVEVPDVAAGAVTAAPSYCGLYVTSLRPRRERPHLLTHPYVPEIVVECHIAIGLCPRRCVHFRRGFPVSVRGDIMHP